MDKAQQNELWKILSSKVTPEFIETDLTVPLEEAARQQELETFSMANNPSTQQGNQPSSAAPVSFQTFSQMAVPARAVGVTVPQSVVGQNTTLSQIRGVNIQNIQLAPGAPPGMMTTALNPSTLVTGQTLQSLSHGPAAVINVNQPTAAGATVLAQPLQVIPLQHIGTSGTHTVQTSQGNISGIIMPLQQHNIGRLPVPPLNQAGPRTIQPKPPGVVAIQQPVQQPRQGRPMVQHALRQPVPAQPSQTECTTVLNQPAHPSQLKRIRATASMGAPRQVINVPRVPVRGMRQPRPAHCNQTPQQRPMLTVPQQVITTRLAAPVTAISSTQLRPIAPAPMKGSVGLQIMSQPVKLSAPIVSSQQVTMAPAVTVQTSLPAQGINTAIPMAPNMSNVTGRTDSNVEPLNLHIQSPGGDAATLLADLEPGEIVRLPYKSDSQPPALIQVGQIASSAGHGNTLANRPQGHPSPVGNVVVSRTGLIAAPQHHIPVAARPELGKHGIGYISSTLTSPTATFVGPAPIQRVMARQSPVPLADRTETVVPAKPFVKKDINPLPDPKPIKTEDSLSHSDQAKSVPKVEPKLEKPTEENDDRVEVPDGLIPKQPPEPMDTGSVPIEYEEAEFVWGEYLEETGATAAPPTAFAHVESSLESGFKKGMKVEVPVKGQPDSYWVATLVMTCGQLLRLRYEGYGDESTADFWLDIMSSESHPLGWCRAKQKTLKPPAVLEEKLGNWHERVEKLYKEAETPDEHLLNGKGGSAPVDQIQTGMRLDVQHSMDPRKAWVATVIENVGGRLLLRLEGMDTASQDFWLFYLNQRVHPLGWAKEHGLQYKPPLELASEKAAEEEHEKWEKILQHALSDPEGVAIPAHIFKDQKVVGRHQFQVGWKVEALHPQVPNQFCPATVTAVLNEYYFIVTIDDLSAECKDKPVRMCCHGNSRGIFPVHWCSYEGIRLTAPKGWHKQDFSWTEYLTHCGAQPAPDEVFNKQVVEHEFERGMRLEAVDPERPNQVCAATITRIIDPLLSIHLDSSSKIVANHIVPVDSQEIFPVGWCESNNYPLRPPRKFGMRRHRVAVVPPERTTMTADEFRSATYSQIKEGGGSSAWCPKIYFNHRCFSGPFLSKSRIAELPKCVGPGPVILVLKEVLSMLINVAYKSSRVLREIQIEGPANPSMHQQVLKAKYKGKSYRAMVEFCRQADQVEDFCRQTCIKLECCPYLFSPKFVNGNCPERCSQLTKTKYTYYYGKKKKRKIGRPPGGHSNLEFGPKKPGKRRKRRRICLVHRKKHVSMDGESPEREVGVKLHMGRPLGPDGAEGTEQVPVRKKRKYTRHLPPPTDIKTRGAKLPNFNLSQRTRRKRQVIEQPMDEEPCIQEQEYEPPPTPREDSLVLDSNPLQWSVQKVVDFIKSTDCANLARIFMEQEIDGQALLLLNLPTIQEHMELKLGPAVKLCHHIERVKIAFYEQFAA